VAIALGKPYVRSIQAFGETSFSKKKLLASGGGSGEARAFAQKSAMRSLIAREIKLMNREPMYLLNGPFVIILLPVMMAVVLAAQPDMLKEAMGGLGTLLGGPGSYLLPAALGAFLGSSTSIACTAVSRDAKALPWIKSLPITPMRYFGAKLAHAELFSLWGSLLGCAAGVLAMKTSALDAAIAFLLALLFSTAFNMAGLWLDTAFPHISWDNPIAAMKQNPNAVVAILGTMGLIGLLALASVYIRLPRYAYVAVYGAVFMIPILAWIRFYPKFAAKRYLKMEA
jgi:ABC-2 type transport system permease protein